MDIDKMKPFGLLNRIGVKYDKFLSSVKNHKSQLSSWRNGVIYETMIKIVIDTNILVSALRSDMGASYALISKLPSTIFDFYLSVPLYMEYQDVLTRKKHMTGQNTQAEILAFLRYLCKISLHQKIFYLWRPWLKDPKDDMVLELAVAAKCQYIITYNLKDFSNIQKFGIKVLVPQAFLEIIEEV